MKKIFALILALTLALSLLSVSAFAAIPDGTTIITIYHTNDSHGRVVSDNGIIGIDTIAAIANSTENALLVDAGDTFHGLPIATLNKGADIAALYNAAGYDVMVPGNHDFNYGAERLSELAALADFDVISSNVTRNGSEMFAGNVIKEVAGVKIGFFGLTTPETSYKANPAGLVGVMFTDPIEAAKLQVASLKSQGANVIIALGHIGVDAATIIKSTDIADAVPEIDVFIDGHSHTEFPGGKLENGVLIAQTGEYEHNLGKVTLTFDNGKLTKSATLIDCDTAKTSAPDSAVAVKITEITAGQDAVLDTIVGKTAIILDGERQTNRTRETNLGNLVSDSMRLETGADVALINGGGLRLTIPVGDIARRDVVGVMPFGNYAVTKNLTGAQLKATLEHSVRLYPELLGGFLQVSGVEFTFDPTQPEGQRVTSVTIGGAKLVDDKEYLIVTNDYLAVGGDGYAEFGTVPIISEGRALDEVLCDYIASLGTVNIAVEGRIKVAEPIIAAEPTTVAEDAPIVIAEITPPVSPKTGDGSVIIIALFMLLTSSAGLAVTLKRGKTRNAE